MGDGFVVSGVQTPGPFVFGQQANHRIEVAFHRRWHFRAFDLEILEVGGAIDEHFAGAIVAVGVVALARGHLGRPAFEVLELLFRLLGEQIIGDADGQLAFAVKIFDDLVVVGVILETAAGVDDAGHSQPVDLPHEMPGRVLLVIRWQLGSLGQGGVKDGRVRFGDQKAGRFPSRVANDLATGEILGVLAVADGAQGGTVEDGAIVKMQDEHRGIGGHRIDLVDGGQPLFGELMFGEAAHHPDPLGSRCPVDLLFEHAHGVGQRSNAVPAQFHIVVQAAADDVHMAVDQAGNHAPAFEIDASGRGSGHLHHILIRAGSDKAPVGDGHRLHLGVLLVQCGDFSVEEKDIRCLCHRVVSILAERDEALSRPPADGVEDRARPLSACANGAEKLCFCLLNPEHNDCIMSEEITLKLCGY